MAEEFAAQIVRRNPLAPGNSHFARTRVQETILALRLAYSIIVQSIVIHLNGECRGLPQQAFNRAGAPMATYLSFAPDGAR